MYQVCMSCIFPKVLLLKPSNLLPCGLHGPMPGAQLSPGTTLCHHPGTSSPFSHTGSISFWMFPEDNEQFKLLWFSLWYIHVFMWTFAFMHVPPPWHVCAHAYTPCGPALMKHCFPQRPSFLTAVLQFLEKGGNSVLLQMLATYFAWLGLLSLVSGVTYKNLWGSGSLSTKEGLSF